MKNEMKNKECLVQTSLYNLDLAAIFTYFQLEEFIYYQISNFWAPKSSPFSWRVIPCTVTKLLAMHAQNSQFYVESDIIHQICHIKHIHHDLSNIFDIKYSYLAYIFDIFISNMSDGVIFMWANLPSGVRLGIEIRQL